MDSCIGFSLGKRDKDFVCSPLDPPLPPLQQQTQGHRLGGLKLKRTWFPYSTSCSNEEEKGAPGVTPAGRTVTVPIELSGALGTVKELPGKALTPNP